MKATLQWVKNAHKLRHTLSVGVMRYLNDFQLPLHKIFTAYDSSYIFSETHLTFSTEAHGNAIFPNKFRKRIPVGTKRNSSGFWMSFQD